MLVQTVFSTQLLTKIDHVHCSVESAEEDDSKAAKFVKINVLIKWQKNRQFSLPNPRDAMVEHQDNDECTVEVQHLTCFTSDRNEVA